MEQILRGPEARAPLPLTDHLLEELLVRIDALAGLVRASAACKTFRCLITDSTFLHRYRSLHPPLLLGFVIPWSVLGFLPADAPHLNAPAFLAFTGAASFSFDHLPNRRGGWSRCGARDGRVLLLSSDPERGLLPELAVCDPLTQGCTLLPPIPDGLLASVSVQTQDNGIHFDAIFDPSESYNEALFRVMYWMHGPAKGALFVYSSISGTWTHGTSIGCDALGLDVELLQPEDIYILVPNQWPSYANSCFYWKQLNINSMVFSTVSLPPDYENRDIVFVEASEGRIGMFSLTNNSPENPQSLCYSIRKTESENANEHPVEITMQA